MLLIVNSVECTWALLTASCQDEQQCPGAVPIRHEAFESFRHVTRSVAAQAISVCQGTASRETPLFYSAKNARRIDICRETASTT
jgi:hypothetical protein